VNLGNMPDGLNAAELEKFRRGGCERKRGPWNKQPTNGTNGV
jgi:hypothetical protein